MLVLDRYPRQGIIIGDDIQIIVLRSERPGCTKLMIRAPREIPVFREEIYKRIKKGIPKITVKKSRTLTKEIENNDGA